MSDIRVNWNGNEADRQIAGWITEGLRDAAEYLLDEANKIVPHDEGNLQSTGLPSVDPQKLEAVVSYDTPYARRLHEHPEYNFQKGRKGKWLEITFRDKGPTALRYVANKVKNRMKGG